MLRLVSDADFNGRVLRALRRSDPSLDVVRVQDVGLRTAPDPDVLEWAATEGRVVLTRDQGTMVGFAYARVGAGLPMPGVVVTRDYLPIGLQVQDILIVAHCSAPNGLADQVVFIPL
jgi:predicted nuclease of predicted toxin-antitoxin system